MFKEAITAPLFLACVVFVVVFGCTVGIAQLNLGTVSRYRIPLLPFLVAALVIVEDRATSLGGRLRLGTSTAPAAPRFTPDAALEPSGR